MPDLADLAHTLQAVAVIAAWLVPTVAAGCLLAALVERSIHDN